MSQRRTKRPPDTDVLAILDILKSTYRTAHPQSRVDSYRQNSASIRIRIIDPDFQALDRVDRDEQIWEILGKLPEDIQSQITILLLLTPEETKTSFVNMDFENPIPSRL
jgi:stress-induced morphogen